MDERSFTSNFEVNAFIYDKKTAAELKKLWFDDLQNCYEIIPEEWTNRQKRQKITESVARLFSPLV